MTPAGVGTTQCRMRAGGMDTGGGFGEEPQVGMVEDVGWVMGEGVRHRSACGVMRDVGSWGIMRDTGVQYRVVHNRVGPRVGNEVTGECGVVRGGEMEDVGSLWVLGALGGSWGMLGSQGVMCDGGEHWVVEGHSDGT